MLQNAMVSLGVDLANKRLAVKDEEGGDVGGFPSVKSLVNVRSNARQATQRREKGLVGRLAVEEVLEIV